MLLPLALALVLAPAPGSGSVELGPGTWHGLHPAAPADVAVPAWAATRRVQLTPAPGGVTLRATWTLRSLSRGAWFSGQVLGAIPGLRVEQVTWDGQPVAVRTTADGVTVAGRVTSKAVLELVAFIPGEPTRDTLQLDLLPAVRGHVEIAAPEGLVPVLRATGPTSSPDLAANKDPAPPDTAPQDAIPIGEVYWTGAARLGLGYTAAKAPTSRQTVVVARAGLGLTVGDAELRGRARLVWEVRQGTIDAVDFTATGTGADLEIKGLNVRDVQRSGDSVRVELQAPVAGRLELDLTWTAPLAKTAESRVPVPQLAFTNVFRSESSLQLARDGEVEAVPDITGWTPTTAAALPAWGQGLVDGAPTAAFRGGGSTSGALDLLRFVPIEGPPVVIDVAAYTIATSREGRALIRAHYEVRNERAATLRVRPPPGFEILGVRVAGSTATPARDRDGAWRIPLQRSVETVSGVLSFPVEIALLGGSGPWDRRERRALTLPQLDAPVAVARITLHLPPGYRSRQRPGDGEVVAAFTRGDGITYGLGVGAVGAAEADAVFQSAVKNWLGNDFDAAQADLDNLKAMGASNENITRLQGNLDVIAGRGDKDDKGVQRRIREQAKARALGDQQLQEKLLTDADEARKSGDYEAAQNQYRAAIDVGDRLAKLEQKESVEQQTRNQSIALELESTAGEFKAVKRRARKTKQTESTRFGSVIKSTPSSAAAPDGDADGVADAPPGPGKPADPPAILPTSDNTRDYSAVVDLTPTVDKTTATRPDEAEKKPPVGGEKLPEPTTTTPAQDIVLNGRPVAPAGAPAGPMPPAPAPDAAGIRIAGTTAAESVYVQDAAASGRSFQRLAGVAGRVRDRRQRRVRTRDTLDTKYKAVNREQSDEPTAAAPPADVLPEPKVTASAVSVVVPQVGQAVLYQRLLLPADALHAIDISAREPWIAKD